MFVYSMKLYNIIVVTLESFSLLPDIVMISFVSKLGEKVLKKGHGQHFNGCMI